MDAWSGPARLLAARLGPRPPPYLKPPTKSGWKLRSYGSEATASERLPRLTGPNKCRRVCLLTKPHGFHVAAGLEDKTKRQLENDVRTATLRLRGDANGGQKKIKNKIKIKTRAGNQTTDDIP